MSKIFIDTNILVYSMDSFSLPRQKNCRMFLKELTDDLRGVISTQVMNEIEVRITHLLNQDTGLVKLSVL